MLYSAIFNFLSKIFLFTGKLGPARLFSFDKKLPPEKEKEYFERIKLAKNQGKEDAEAIEIITRHNLRLVAHIAKKYKSPHQTTDDLISIGSIGLIKAAKTFEIEKAKNFSSYASRCIENEILMVLRAEKKLNAEISLSCPLGSDGDGGELYLKDMLEDTSIDLEKIAQNHITIKKVKALMDLHLSEREKEILQCRYGLNGTTPLTQKETSVKLNISRSYISRLEQNAIKKLTRLLKSNP